MTRQHDHDLEVVRLREGEIIEGKSFNRCAIVFTTNNKLINCQFWLCDLHCGDGDNYASGVIYVGSPVGNRYMQMDEEARAILRPQLKLLGVSAG